MKRSTILTGDRPTGPLHLGHYAGSLLNRIRLQHDHDQYILIADLQALTDNARNPEKIRAGILQVATDYLAAGIDPSLSTICLQSGLPALSELTSLYLNHVSLARLERNPTIREEIRQRGFERDIPAGFLCYPAAQAADITAFKADLVPVGSDQAPMIELANEIVDRINRMGGHKVLPRIQGMIPAAGRLPGIDGKGKMSKSAGNSIPITAGIDEIRRSVNAMFTDPDHLRVSDPGKIEGNVVFSYLDAFDPDQVELMHLKEHYQEGGLGDRSLKDRLISILDDHLAPIRERHGTISQDPGEVIRVLREGTLKAREITEGNKVEISRALGVFDLI